MYDKSELAAEAHAFLHEMPTGVLATVSTTGQPYSSTIYFTAAEDFSIYFIVSHHSEKFKNLTLNPLASFTVGTGPAYKEVMIRGNVTQVNDPHARESTLAIISKRVASPMSEWPVFKISSLETGGTALFKLTPTDVRYLDLTHDDADGDHTKHIYQLVP